MLFIVMLNMPQIAPEAFLPTQSRQTPCLTIFHPLGLAALLSWMWNSKHWVGPNFYQYDQ